jgi:hypothetical protein
MLKDIEDIRKSARVRAERRWQNHAVERAFKAARQEKLGGAPTEPEDPKIAEVIKNEQLKKGAIYKAETRFARDIREMLEGHTHRNLVEYKRALQAKIHRLKLEKYRRLKARHDAREALKQDLPKKDLFK